MPGKGYEKGFLIHSGPFADVYQGKDVKGNIYGLKVADLDFQRKPHDFRQEIQIILTLRHQNVVQYIDSYTLGEDQYLVMPFYAVDLAGVMARHMKRKTKFNFSDPLKNTLVEYNNIPLGTADQVVHGLIDAVRYVHDQGIIHRDIKPANVFFASFDSLQPILGDFGISYNSSKPKEPPSSKYTDVGTGYYKAPELCFGISDYGYEVDLWALGILISYLYSKDGTPANSVVLEGDDLEIADFVLIQGTFEAFGTPTTRDSASDLFWPRLADADLTFLKLIFKHHDRKTKEELLPRCEDSQIQKIFSALTLYSHRELLDRRSLSG